MVANHISDVLAAPTAIKLSNNLEILRFESMKVASAVQAVSDLLAAGTVDRERTTLVDSSSGVYAYALALAAHRFGMKSHIIGSTTIDSVLKGQLEVLGTSMEQVPPSSSLKLDQNKRVELVKDFLESNPDAYWMQQYHDAIHYRGYDGVVRGSLSHLEGKQVTLVGGVGSGASTGGLAEGLRNIGCTVRVVGIQPFGSISFGSENVQDPEMLVAGIGSSIPFGNISYALYSEMHWLEYNVAKRGTLSLLRECGLFAGFSAGATFTVADHLSRRDPDQFFLAIAADTGNRYAPHLFSDWESSLANTEAAPTYINDIEALARPWSAMLRPEGFETLNPIKNT